MYRQRQEVDIKRGNVIGDGAIDTVYLMAEKTPHSPYWVNIEAVVQDGRTNRYTRIPLKENSGYNPTLFLGDFTGDKVEDIMVVMDTGGSGGMINAYIFAFRNGQFRPLFDSEVFNNRYKYSVFYLNQYKAQVNSINVRQTFIIDLSTKNKEYLSEIYNADGTLKAPIQGFVSPIAGLYPVDFDRNGVYELLAYQNIAGRYNADRLGYVQTTLKWNGREFGTEVQNVAIFGGDQMG
ncbi:hypothetical protein [Fictibacillus terranigra]|uniref:Spore coat protein n=1 Tax=Fictibacillus terranigra TaxID=3058424 RepID=A0ABT8EB06_9BACL|nr:hypothetical protein [Fictibacillus sp. CENA-BCM004]MDN4075103.1 hypothetical protein [Fictibacillus sp. CENA-BCM004]